MEIAGKFTQDLIPIAVLEVGADPGDLKPQEFIVDTGFNRSMLVSKRLQRERGFLPFHGMSEHIDTSAGRIIFERCTVYVSWDTPPKKVVLAHVQPEPPIAEGVAPEGTEAEWNLAAVGTELLENMHISMTVARTGEFMIS